MQPLRTACNTIQRVRMWGLYALVLGFGCVGIVLGGWYAWHAVDLVRTGVRVEARVSSVRADEQDPERFEPTYEYRVDGTKYWYEQTNPTVKPRPSIGDRRELVVHPDDPRDVTTPDFFGFWGTPLVLVTFGVLAFWALWYRLLRRRRRHA